MQFSWCSATVAKRPFLDQRAPAPLPPPPAGALSSVQRHSRSGNRQCALPKRLLLSGCHCSRVRLVRHFKDHLDIAVPTAGTLQAGCELIKREGLAPPAQMTVNLDSVPCLATGPKRGSSGQARHWPQRTMLRLDESRGLRPPPSSAEGLDRVCHPAFVCHQAFDAKMRLNSTQTLCQPFFAPPDLRGF